MSKKIVIAAVAVLSLSVGAIAQVAYAHEHGKNSKVQLDEPQRAELKTMYEAHLDVIDEMHIEIAQKRAELQAITNAEKPDTKDAARVGGEIEQLRQDIRDTQRAFQIEVSEKFDIPLAAVGQGRYHDGPPYYENSKHERNSRNNQRGEKL